MNSKFRVKAAMELRPVDRIPVFPVVTTYLASRVLGCKYQEFILNPLLIYRGLRELHRYFSFDGFEVNMGPASQDLHPRVKEIGAERYLVNQEDQPLARLQEDDQPVPINPTLALEKKSDLDKLSVIPASHFIENGCTKPVADLVKDVGDLAFIAGAAANQTMNSLVAWRGSDQAMMDLVEDPPFVHAVMERATDMSIEVGKALIHAGVDGIYIGDAWASSSIISPKYYEEFCLPYHRKAAQAFHALGVKVYLHICGNSNPILSLMADTGVDAIEPLDVNGGVKLEEVRSHTHDRVCLKGGLSTLLLLNGTEKQVYDEAKRCIKLLGPTGYILGSADDIPRDAPFKNILAMVRSVKSMEER